GRAAQGAEPGLQGLGEIGVTLEHEDVGHDAIRAVVIPVRGRRVGETSSVPVLLRSGQMAWAFRGDAPALDTASVHGPLRTSIDECTSAPESHDVRTVCALIVR